MTDAQQRSSRDLGGGARSGGPPTGTPLQGAGPLGEVFRLFARLGFTAFGGPAVHIAMMRDEVVRRRAWVSEREFLDLLGVANLIPGPTSTELAIYLGYRRAGPAGLAAAGVAFIMPAVLIVLACAWAYVRFGTTPGAGRVFYGVTPVLIAVVAQALWGLARTAVHDAVTGVAAAAVLALTLLGANVLALMVAGGLIVGAVRLAADRNRDSVALAFAGGAPVLPAAAAGSVALAPLFLVFLKIGAVLFGSGYVLLAFLRQDLVVHLGWLTDRQLLDAVAVGQFTPGPVFTTATFVGYVLAGLPGAAAATIGIFLPSFLFVAATYRFIGPLRESLAGRAFLDGVNAAAVALMAAVTWQLARSAIVDPVTAAIGIVGLLALVRLRANSALLMLAGALLGLAIGHAR